MKANQSGTWAEQIRFRHGWQSLREQQLSPNTKTTGPQWHCKHCCNFVSGYCFEMGCATTPMAVCDMFERRGDVPGTPR